MKEDSKEQTPQISHSGSPYPVSANDDSENAAKGSNAADDGSARAGPIVPILKRTPTGWESGPEELVVAYTGGIIQNFPRFKEMCQEYIDRLVMRTGPQKGGKSVFLREASDGGVVGAGVLAGTVANK